ncbi:serine protein kinase RIO [Methanohalophilus sp.]|uniref:serine protein kinase RIO n=1 Tax=Methanohalophilus sp. TaxID=1966352 RepID=UPI0026150D06|nr:serine protein kinase RIO [Methanohalophilus sp.]MDK2892846.1 kinase 1 [Methanohalophilus sp.]
MRKSIPKHLRKIESDIDKMRIRQKDSNSLKVKDAVFDEATLKSLYHLSKEGVIEALGGPISTGKEANVFLAEGKDFDLAIKIYRISTSTFRAMEEYILGDPRFKSIRHKKKDVVFAWTRKEFRNLLRAEEVGIRVPKPITTYRNILVMQFIGEEEKAFPPLKYIHLEKGDAKEMFETILKYLNLLYSEANLVHGDLSEYNILVNPSTLEPYIIDMGQAVTLEHPSADAFLKRDLKNLTRYFRKYGIEATDEQLYKMLKTKNDPED